MENEQWKDVIDDVEASIRKRLESRQPLQFDLTRKFMYFMAKCNKEDHLVV